MKSYLNISKYSYVILLGKSRGSLNVSKNSFVESEWKIANFIFDTMSDFCFDFASKFCYSTGKIGKKGISIQLDTIVYMSITCSLIT